MSTLSPPAAAPAASALAAPKPPAKANAAAPAPPAQRPAAAGAGDGDNGQGGFAAELQRQADATRQAATNTEAQDAQAQDADAQDEAKANDKLARQRGKTVKTALDPQDLPPATAALPEFRWAGGAAGAAGLGQPAGAKGVASLKDATARWNSDRLNAQFSERSAAADSRATQGAAAGGAAVTAFGSSPGNDPDVAALTAASASVAKAEPIQVAADAGAGLLPSLAPMTDTPSAPAPAQAPTEVPTASAQLTMPPSSPVFGAALGEQLNHWLREGVQHAQVELHPRDLGPISVQISVEGGQTRIDLGADVASTRQALSDAMPALADALRDVGLTLSGGGVFDQARQHMPQAPGALSGGNRSALGGSSDAADPAAPPQAIRTRRGLLDLYA